MAYYFISNDLGSIDARCHARISEHIHIKGIDIYFGHKDKVHVINKQLIVDVFGICVEGYVKNPKGQVNKSLTLQTLHSCKIAPTKSIVD
jgi:hypothetical protein